MVGMWVIVSFGILLIVLIVSTIETNSEDEWENRFFMQERKNLNTLVRYMPEVEIPDMLKNVISIEGLSRKEKNILKAELYEVMKQSPV